MNGNQCPSLQVGSLCLSVNTVLLHLLPTFPLSLPSAMRVMTIPVDSMTKPVLRATEISKFYTLHMMPLQIDID